VIVERVMVVAIGAYFVVTGIWALLSPRRALESNYRWDRRWTRVFSLGRIAPKARPLTDRAIRLTSVLGAVFVVGGIALLFFGLRALSGSVSSPRPCAV
jgi:uncharacterized membrane protein HdeD (DUF308 family)